MDEKLYYWRKAKGCTIDCEIDLAELFETNEERDRFEGKWNDFITSDPDNIKVFRKKGDKLSYKSEQLVPTKTGKRPPLLLVLGNPATYCQKPKRFLNLISVKD